MKNTFEPSPGWRSFGGWGLRMRTQGGGDTVEEVMRAYYAGWFLDAVDGPLACKRGREEQQFPAEELRRVSAWLAGADEGAYAAARAGSADSAICVVFAYEHFSRFEAAPRVWPPLVPATYWCPVFRHVMAAEVHEETECVGGALTYRRDWKAPRPTGTISYVCRATPAGQPTLWVYFTV